MEGLTVHVTIFRGALSKKQLRMIGPMSHEPSEHKYFLETLAYKVNKIYEECREGQAEEERLKVVMIMYRNGDPGHGEIFMAPPQHTSVYWHETFLTFLASELRKTYQAHVGVRW